MYEAFFAYYGASTGYKTTQLFQPPITLISTSITSICIVEQCLVIKTGCYHCQYCTVDHCFVSSLLVKKVVRVNFFGFWRVRTAFILVSLIWGARKFNDGGLKDGITLWQIFKFATTNKEDFSTVPVALYLASLGDTEVNSFQSQLDELKATTSDLTNEFQRVSVGTTTHAGDSRYRLLYGCRHFCSCRCHVIGRAKWAHPNAVQGRRRPRTVRRLSRKRSQGGSPA